MKLPAKVAYFIAFSAVFAALGAYVFWGTWALGFEPIMPDAGYIHPPYWAAQWWHGLLECGRLIPDDFKVLLGGPYFWQELQYLFATYFAALAVVYYCRGRGLPRVAAYGAGLLLAFSGYWLTLFSAGHLGFYRWMTYGLFSFGLIDRGLRKGKLRHWLLLGATEAWASFNQQDIWLLFALFTAAYFIWASIRERKFDWKGTLISAVAFVLIGLPNFHSTILGTFKGREEQIAKGENITNKNGSEAEKRWEFVTNWSMPIEDTAEFINSRVHGDTSCPLVLSINRLKKGVKPYTGALGRPMNAKAGNYRQHSLYVGWVTCLLALIGAIYGIKGRKGEILFFVGAAVVFYLLSLGRYFEPMYRIIFALPAGDMIRCPVKWHHLTEVALAILAAYGIGALIAAFPKQAKVVTIALAAVVILGAADLAGEAARYCAPVNISRAYEKGWSMHFEVMTRQQFANPQIAAMVKAGRIISVASYLGSPEYFLVQVIEPFGPRQSGEIKPFVLGMGIVSILSSLGVIVLSVRRRG